MVGLISGVHRFRRVSVCIHPGMNACICMYIYICTNIHIYICTSACARISIHAHIDAHIQVDTERNALGPLYTLGLGWTGSDTEHPGADLS